MRWRINRAGLLLCLSALALTACAEANLLFHTAKQVQRGTEDLEGAGRYKVGNPYEINGAWYYPAEDYSYTETGIASWYGSDFHGLTTANGETYDMNSLTAAHRTLPMPSAVQVTNLENGRSLVLRVNDRGPFARGRIIDVSRQAARMLGFERKGTAKVRVDILPNESQQLKLAALNGSGVVEQQVQVAASPRIAVKTEPLHTAGQRNGPNGVAVTERSVLNQASPVEPVLPSSVRVVPVPATNIYVQVGAFSDLGNALRLRDRLYGSYPSAAIARVQFGVEELYRVRIGPFADVSRADATVARLLNGTVSEARLVVE